MKKMIFPNLLALGQLCHFLFWFNSLMTSTNSGIVTDFTAWFIMETRPRVSPSFAWSKPREIRKRLVNPGFHAANFPCGLEYGLARRVKRKRYCWLACRSGGLAGSARYTSARAKGEARKIRL